MVGLSTTLATNAIVEGHASPICLLLAGYEPSALDRAGLRQALGGDPVVFIAGGHQPTGDEQHPLDLSAAAAAIKAHAPKVAAFAVSAYFSVRNPAHEIALRRLVRELTDLPVSCGHELTSKLDAPRRALTCALNARLIPQLQQLVRAVAGAAGRARHQGAADGGEGRRLADRSRRRHGMPGGDDPLRSRGQRRRRALSLGREGCLRLRHGRHHHRYRAALRRAPGAEPRRRHRRRLPHHGGGGGRPYLRPRRRQRGAAERGRAHRRPAPRHAAQPARPSASREPGDPAPASGERRAGSPSRAIRAPPAPAGCRRGEPQSQPDHDLVQARRGAAASGAAHQRRRRRCAPSGASSTAASS